jgi:hypothetical protein
MNSFFVVVVCMDRYNMFSFIECLKIDTVAIILQHAVVPIPDANKATYLTADERSGKDLRLTDD